LTSKQVLTKVVHTVKGPCQQKGLISGLQRTTLRKEKQIKVGSFKLKQMDKENIRFILEIIKKEIFALGKCDDQTGFTH